MARVRTSDGKEFNVKSILAEDEPDDLMEAFVDAPYDSVSYLIAAGSVPNEGDPVMVIGSAMGVDKVASQGNVHANLNMRRFLRGDGISF
jgi:S1-C subfamily serine protease